MKPEPVPEEGRLPFVTTGPGPPFGEHHPGLTQGVPLGLVVVAGSCAVASPLPPQLGKAGGDGCRCAWPLARFQAGLTPPWTRIGFFDFTCAGGTPVQHVRP